MYIKPYLISYFHFENWFNLATTPPPFLKYNNKPPQYENSYLLTPMWQMRPNICTLSTVIYKEMLKEDSFYQQRIPLLINVHSFFEFQYILPSGFVWNKIFVILHAYVAIKHKFHFFKKFFKKGNTIVG